MTQRVLGVCADDYGLNEGVDETLLDLAQRGRLTALSCLTNTGRWGSAAGDLRGLHASVQLGLHFNLTEGVRLAPCPGADTSALPALPRLIAATHLRSLPVGWPAAELAAQWQAFVDHTGRRPDYIDGHQHVHHLPQVRDAVLALARGQGVPVRNTGRLQGPGFAAKRGLIAGTGGRRLQRLLQRQGVPHNTVLLGVYDFIETDYRSLVRRWLAAAPARGALLMCHPARRSQTGDPIAPAREREAAYLGSTAFTEDLAAAGFSLGSAWA